MEELRPGYTVGIDRAKDLHETCVLDPKGEVRERFPVPHTAEGLGELLRRLRRLAPVDRIHVAIERPSGLLVDTLLEAGFTVVPIHPNALKATRPRYSAAQGKSDPGDAYILADPTPESARHLGEKRLCRFLLRHAYCGRRSAGKLLDRLRAAPEGHAGELESETKGQLVRALSAVLRPLVQQIREIDGTLAAHLAQHPDGKLVQSFPRTGTVNAAQILAELGSDRLRFQTAEQLCAEAGVAPVTYSSGKHRGVACRFACNKRLRQALTTWADNSRHAHPWAASVYRDARARRCNHPHAVRILARAWTRVLWRCWQDHTPYTPERHGRALPFLAPQQPAPTAA